jgi:signal peptide peptidase SppA
MSFAYGHIAQRLFDTPLMYDPRKAEAFVDGLGGRIAGSDIVVANPGGAVDHSTSRPSAAKLGDKLAKLYERYDEMPFYLDGTVAIIPIEGSLVHKGSFVGKSSGVTSYEGLQAQISIAKKSPKVRGVVFEVDSFGGEVSGGFETAAAISDLSKAKPTIAILTDYAYSAAYLLASQARQIIAPKFGGAGSIGVIMMHADYSRQIANAGVSVTIIRAGGRKAEGNPYEPLPSDVAERWQAQVEAMRQDFAAVVGKGRGSRFTAAKALKTEAEAYDANGALALGLIDAIADPVAAYDAFVTAINRT